LDNAGGQWTATSGAARPLTLTTNRYRAGFHED
jgi:hypothetical protein